MNLDFPFNPVKRTQEIEKLVMRSGERLYYRFRPAPYYGGIATADAVGCSFLCAYCWNYGRNLNPSQFNNFYRPKEVAERLLNIARRKSFRLFRMSGAEPILGESSLEHLIHILELIYKEKPNSVFVLETNGFYLGYHSDSIKRLRFENLMIRVCLKGVDEESFEKITGARKEFFLYPIIALKEMKKHEINTWPAIMGNLFSREDTERLKDLLKKTGVASSLEKETLEAYPFVIENMTKRRIEWPNRQPG